MSRVYFAPDEDSLILSNWNTHKREVIGTVLGRTCASVSRRARRIGAAVPPRFFTDNEDSIIASNCHAMTPEQLASEIGRSRDVCKARVYKLKLRFRAPNGVEPGKVYGHLTALRPVRVRKHGRVRTYWECLCVCDNRLLVLPANIINRPDKSCGCLRNQQLSDAAKLRWSEARAGGRRYGRYPATLQSALVAKYNSYRAGAVARDILFELSLEEFSALVIQPCHYCDLPPSNVMTNYPSFPFSGVDRKDNEQYYRNDNSLPCCTDCNLAKGTKPYATFIAWRRRLAATALRDDPTLMNRGVHTSALRAVAEPFGLQNRDGGHSGSMASSAS